MPNPTVFPDNPNDPVNLNSIFGQIKPPAAISNFIKPGDQPGQGLFTFISLLIKIITSAAGLLVLFQFIMAGYDYISAGGDEKKISAAWAKIWQSLVGLLIITSAFILIGVIETVFKINILDFQISGP